MKTIRTKSGRSIAYEQSGRGSPLVLVHGGFVDHSSWRLVQPLMSEDFTVYAVDRLGHGESDPYPAKPTMEDEYTAITEFIEVINEPIYLVGHSSGARVALHAALRTNLVRKLVLYEPPELNSLMPETEQRLAQAAGDREQLIMIAMADVVGGATGEKPSLEMLKQLPIWNMLFNNALSIPSELPANATYRFEPGEFRAFEVPTALLLGTKSSAFMRQSIEYLNTNLPNSTIIHLDGQGHGAAFAAPELLVSQLRDFENR